MKRRRKTVALPVTGDVDITRVLPIVSHPRFQALRFRKQLGMGHFVFPNGHHSRWEHSVGVYKLTRRRADRWRDDGILTPEAAWSLTLLGLLHDIGHGPYSHLIEPLCAQNHKRRALDALLEMEPTIEACDGSYEEIRALFAGENPLGLAVSHHPLGTDKLDYLSRDALHTNSQVSVSTEKVLNYTTWLDGQLVIDSKITEEVMRLQDAYSYMFQQVYLRRPTQIVDRYFQKMLGRLMTGPERGEPLTEDELWEMTDAELDTRMITQVKLMYDRVRTRQFPKTVLSLRLEEFVRQERVANKPLQVIGVPRDVIDRFEQFRRPQEAQVLERTLAELIDIPEEAVVVLPVVHSERFVPKDIPVDYGRGGIGLLSHSWPKHFESLRERADGYLAVRVAVFGEYRHRAGQPVMAERIYHCLIEATQHAITAA